MIDYFGGQYRFLSNFFPAPIEFNGLKYPTVEHAYQSLKAVDLKERMWVHSAESPGLAKRRGKQVNLRSDWEKIKLEVMYDLVKAKFDQNKELAKLLLLTQDEDLVEGNTWGDKFWGQVDGEGENHLGKILMRVRKELRDAAPDSSR